ncbi:hypothetical protein BOX15_Mlig005852g1 [Macrostomum lignano]|uniref:IGFBP N-terminal domain-containing protein n=1 Tax=Macrostomum lignano TaxID=282301 RepID=A0A267DCY1_9PLAT|nr:hypothetical protein BOX15_Mlig005852g6 [Macrostomum lignano]PAA58358.1 hypothetical protein BOX15_Mlig005852g4 [Macrostomum lignano]PAA58359.1 hypothetical protein BOX15_Mlig005852g5 [Macrostomum lignano]PAA61993.1 hypothetical protein BOX15_Mlig005852g2 [Macrostomum lignano]PAA61994.1 hypothetical protein BOX15_Mlig005852g3 [Macrostomum lignano]
MKHLVLLLVLVILVSVGHECLACPSNCASRMQRCESDSDCCSKCCGRYPDRSLRCQGSCRRGPIGVPKS